MTSRLLQPTKAMTLRETSENAANAKEPPAFVFKARPVNKAILESAGDMGVPRVDSDRAGSTEQSQSREAQHSVCMS